MKKHALLSIGIIATLELAAQPFWQQTNGPGGGKVSATAYDASTGDLYVCMRFPYLFGNNGASGRTFRSTDNGSTWIPAETGMERLEVLQLAVRPGVQGELYAIAQDTTRVIPQAGFHLRCYRSNSNGGSWTLMNSNYFPTDDWPVALVANSSGAVYAARSKFGGSAAGGVDISTDNGATWAAVNTGLTNRKMCSLAIGASDAVHAGTDSVAGNPGQVYVLSGNSWTVIGPSGASVTALAYDAGSNSMYAGTHTPANATGKIFRSVAGGAWQQLSGYPGHGVSKIRLTPAGGLVVVTFSAGVFHSPDGNQWTAMTTNGLPASLTLHSLEVDAVGNVLTSDWDGVLKAGLSSTSWDRANTGIICTHSNSIAFNALGELLVSMPNGVKMSSDQGASWSTALSSAKQAFSVSRNRVTGEMFAAMASNSQMLYRSTSNGHPGSWVQSDNGLMGSITTFMDHDQSGRMFLGAGWGRQVFTSTDAQGTTWVANQPFAQSGMPQSTVTTAIAVDRNSPAQNLYTGMEAFGVFRSTDAGQTYTGLGLTGGDISSIRVTAAGDIIVGHALSQGSGVFRSSNNGDIWSANLLPGRGVVNALALVGEDSIFVGTTTGVHLLTDGGQTVTTLNSGLVGLSVLALEIGPDMHLYAAVSGGGIHRSVQPVSGLVTADHYTPANDRYLRVYPNPSNGEFTIYSGRHGSSNCHISIVNHLGQEVERFRHNGTATLQHLPSGIYTVRMIEDGQMVASQRAIMVR